MNEQQFLEEIKRTVLRKQAVYLYEIKEIEITEMNGLLVILQWEDHRLEMKVRGSYNTDFSIFSLSAEKEVYTDYQFYGMNGRTHFSIEKIFWKWRKDFVAVVELM